MVSGSEVIVRMVDIVTLWYRGYLGVRKGEREKGKLVK
jgi:hypothetical protein